MNSDPTDRGAQYAAAFMRAWEQLLGVELGYVDDEDDEGGPTIYGVTQRLARRYGYTGDMRQLPIEQARSIAKREFWDSMGLDSVAWLSEPVAAELLEAGYHLGPRHAAAFLQRALNAFGDGSLTIDSDIGPKTLKSLTEYVRRRGPHGVQCLLRVLNSQQCVAYLERVEVKPKKRKFVFGWVSKRVRIDA